MTSVSYLPPRRSRGNHTGIRMGPEHPICMAIASRPLLDLLADVLDLGDKLRDALLRKIRAEVHPKVEPVRVLPRLPTLGTPISQLHLVGER